MEMIKRNRKSLVYLLLVAFVLVQGIFYSFKLPFGQVPDEMTHYQMMEEEFGTTGYYNDLVSKLYYPAGLQDIPRNYEAKVNQDSLQSVSLAHFSKPLTLGSFHPRLTAMRHLPCGIGFYLGIAMDFPILWCTYMAEIFSVLFYAGIGCLALKWVPFKKDIFAFCMLIPESIHMCASVNYDSVIIPVSFLLFAYILKLYDSREPVRWRNLAAVFGLAAVLLVTKPPYVLIALTILIIPPDRYSLKIGRKFELMGFCRRRWYIALIVLVLAGGAGIFLFRKSTFFTVILSDILRPGDFFALMKRTYDTWGTLRIVQTVGMFGWHDSQVSTIFIIGFFMMMTYLNSCTLEEETTNLSGLRRGWLVLVFLGIFLVIELVFQRWSYEYNGWNMDADLAAYQSYLASLPAILGVQGRYWIPCLPVLLVGLSGRTARKHRKLYWSVQAVYYVIAFFSVMHVLDLRYWIR